MARPKKTAGAATPVETFVHADDQRTNIPTAELETFMKDEDRAHRNVTYPRPSELLYPRDPAGDPQLVWRGKDEQDRRPLEVMAPPIYIQEKIHPKAIIEDLRKQKRGEAPAQADLFSDFNGIDFDDLVDFYQHEQHWSNRMILGDSLEVMTSLAEREGLKGQVQCLYMDPPYGIKFGSNWQTSTRKRDVKDGSIPDTTRQPEQIKAFRDTWVLGVNSYLSYLRDRVQIAHSLLNDRGSLFLQIGDENIHLVRSVLDEVFGHHNFVSQITFSTTSGFADARFSRATNYLLWYAKDAANVTINALFVPRESDRDYNHLALPDGSWRAATRKELSGDTALPDGARLFMPGDLTSQGAASEPQLYEHEGRTYSPPANAHWKASYPAGMDRLRLAGRIMARPHSLRYKRFVNDFGLRALTNLWTDTTTGTQTGDKLYVVQTAVRVVERCILLTTLPGDLVLDPTCGSGTSAYVSEQWGRRWITVDTSRVALTLARQRLMAARLPYYQLADEHGSDLRRGFVYKTVPRITLKAIANNLGLREGMKPPEIAESIAQRAEQAILYDQPSINNSIVRVTGPFTVESLSPSSSVLAGAEADGLVPTLETSADFAAWISDNLRVAGVQNTVRNQRLNFDRLESWPGQYIHAVGEYTEEDKPRRAAICIGPQYGTVDADLVRDAAKEAAGFFDILIVCGFAFDAYIANEFKQLGNLTILKANMNPDLSMGGDLLKKTGTGNLFTVFGEPDIDIRRENGLVVAEIKGLDVYDPTTGQVRSHTTADIACWFIDSAYDGNSFFVRHAYFTGAGDPYKSLRAALKADIDEGAWASLYQTVSRPFDIPKTGRIAVKVINHYGDEVMKVYEVSGNAPRPTPPPPVLRA
jgi:adenine-specific DNA-methyltransferase